MEQDMRNGVVRFDGWVLPAKLVDLPTIIETHKTLDNKNFYKTSDIAQILICKEEADETKEEPEENVKKSKDGKDKKYLYQHGITKPLKNVRKKRFRKTLRKKYVDFPEIEKEVKRLLRIDNEAKHVLTELIDGDEEIKNDSKEKDSSYHNNELNSGYDEGDLFGDLVSSSDEDNDSDENSRMSTTNFKDYNKEDNDSKLNDNSNLTFSNIFQQSEDSMFASTCMFILFLKCLYANYFISIQIAFAHQSESLSDSIRNEENNQATSALETGIEDEHIRRKIQELENEIDNIHTQRVAQQMEMNNIENNALRQRFQNLIDDFIQQELNKKRELEELKSKL